MKAIISKMLEIIKVTSLDKCFTSFFLISMILFVRKSLNSKSIKSASVILWTILFTYLIIPYSMQIVVNEDNFLLKNEYINKLLKISDYYSNIIIKAVDKVLYQNNRLIVALLLTMYIIIQIIKTTKAVGSSIPVYNNQVIYNALKLFNLKRDVKILLNDSIKMPITYGVIKPKIILSSDIFDDEVLLKYVMIHELTHISRFDIIFNHLKYFIACIYWYNPLIFAICKYVEDDMEILCDKLVLKKLGGTKEHKKEYLESMMKLAEKKYYEKRDLPLKMHPTLERIIIIKNYKVKISGVICLVLVMLLSITSFASVEIVNDNTTVSNISGVNDREGLLVNIDNRTQKIREEEYNRLNLDPIFEIGLRSANISDTQTLERYGFIEYSFDMTSSNTAYHDGFTTKISNVSCDSGVFFEVVIEENTTEIYRASFDNAVTLTTKARRNNRYRVTIINKKTSNLKFDIDINSYVR